MPVVELVPTSIVSSTGTWTNLSAGVVAVSDDNFASTAIAGNSFVAEITDQALGSSNTIQLFIEWNISGSATRTKNLLVELIDAAGTVLLDDAAAPISFQTPSVSGNLPDTIESSAVLNITGLTESDINGARLRVTMQEGGGMADTVAVQIDKVWTDLDYNEASTVHSLTPESTSQSQASETPALVQVHSLTPNDTSQAQASENPSIGGGEPHITDNLVAYYRLETAGSGTATDSHGSHDLTEVGDIINAVGKIGNAASFINTGVNRLTRSGADTDLSVVGTDATWAFWLYREIGAGGVGFVKRSSVDGGLEFTDYGIFVDSTPAFYVGNDSVIEQVNTDGVHTLSDETWYFVVCWIDGGTLNIQIDDNTPISAPLTITPQNHTDYDLFLGGKNADNTLQEFKGRLDELAFFKRVLTSAERTWLYNSGAGRSYAEVLAGMGDTLMPDGTTQSQSSETPVLTQHHVLTPVSTSQGQSTDTASVTQSHVLSPQDTSQAQVSENPSLTLAGSINPLDTAQSQTTEQPALTQGHSLTVDSTSQSQTTDAAQLVQAHSLTANNTSQSQSTETTTLTQAHVLNASDTAQSQSTDTTSLTQSHQIAPESTLQSQSSSNPALILAGQLVPQSTSQGQSTESPSLTQSHGLNVDSTAQSQTSETPSLSAGQSITPESTSQSQSTEDASLTQAHGLAPEDTQQAQVSGNPALEIGGFTLVPLSTVSSQAIETAILTQNHLLDPDDTFQTQTAGTPSLGAFQFGFAVVSIRRIQSAVGVARIQSQVKVKRDNNVLGSSTPQSTVEGN